MAGISVDVGTSVVKAAAYDANSKLLGVWCHPAPVLRRHSRFSEYDMDTLWESICDVVRQAASELDERVDRVAVTGQGDGCWLISNDGRSVGNAVLWNDGRSSSVVERWREDGSEQRIFDITGSATFPGAQSAILAWLRDNDPARLQGARYALFCSGWLFYQMTGMVSVERSDASLPWLNIREREYSTEAVRLRGLEWASHLLPPLIDSAERGHTISAEAAAAMGVPAGISVTYAPFDAPAMAIGAGVVDPGETLVILGTTLIVESVVDVVDTSGKSMGMTLCTGAPDTWLRLFGTLSGTDSLNFLVGLLGYDSAAELADEAATSEPGARGVRVLPYFSPAGERAPFIDSSVSATVTGLNLDRTRADLARAHLEGLTFAIRHCLDQLSEPPQRLSVCGGGAESLFWCQLIADVTGLETNRIAEPELGARGAELVAQAAARGLPVRAVAKSRMPSGEKFLPNPAQRGVYDDGYRRFHTLRTSVTGKADDNPRTLTRMEKLV